MIRIWSIVALITHIVIIIKKPVREAKARIWAVVPLKEVYNSLPVDLIVIYMNPIRTLIIYLFQIHFKKFLPPTHVSPSGLFSSGFPTKMFRPILK
jgi:hypothetical protein